MFSNIDFSDYESQNSLSENFSEYLLKALTNKSINNLEDILINVQNTIMPCINMLLNLKNLYMVHDLIDAYQYILSCRLGSCHKPYPNINKYIEYVDITGLIVGEMEESTIYSEEEIIIFQENYYQEIDTLSNDNKVICEYAFNIFSEYYYFLNYFAFEEEELSIDRITELCISSINAILFDILWNIDDEMLHTYDNSYFKVAYDKILTIL